VEMLSFITVLFVGEKLFLEPQPKQSRKSKSNDM